MFKLRTPVAAAAIGLAVGLGPTPGHAQDIEVLVALPAATLTFSSAFIAEDAGFYKKEGLKVSHRTIVGVGSPNAVIAGAPTSPSAPGRCSCARRPPGSGCSPSPT